MPIATSLPRESSTPFHSMNSVSAIQRLAVCCGFLGGLVSPEVKAQTPGIPEPPVVLYGRIISAQPAPDPATVSFMLTGSSEAVTTATPARVVTVEGVNWFVVSIPFETRSVQGDPVLTATPGTLALTPADTTYAVSAKVGNASATLPAGAETLLYSAQRQGLIERIDLSLGSETFEAWSQRLFGGQVSPAADADGDGQTNYQEYLAGTDPKNPQSHLALTSFMPAPGGGFTFTWDSVAGKVYRVERSTGAGSWSPVGQSLTGTGGPLSFTDNNPGEGSRLFYRVTVGAP